jgi:hypothetical protein
LVPVMMRCIFSTSCGKESFVESEVIRRDTVSADGLNIGIIAKEAFKFVAVLDALCKNFEFGGQDVALGEVALLTRVEIYWSIA